MTGVVAITGATGFIGRHIVSALLADGCTVRALCRNPDALPAQKGLIVCPGQLESIEDLESLVRGADAVLHCAGVLRGADRAAYHQGNAEGTARLAGAARDAGCRRVLLMSSLAAREPALSVYAESKLAGEAALRDALAGSPGISWEILRPPVVYGPGDRATLVFFRQWQKGLAFVPESGDARLAMIYVENLANIVSQHLSQAFESERIWEIHDGKTGGYAWKDVIIAAEHCFGRPIRSLRLPKALLMAAAALDTGLAKVTKREAALNAGKVRELYHPDWTCRSNLADAVTGGLPLVGIEEGFEKTVAWYKSCGWLR